MKKIYETVSDMILPAIVFLAIMAILAGSSLFHKIGKRMEVQGKEFQQMEDVKAVQAVCERDAPEIQCIGKKLWDVGQAIPVSGIFEALDAEGNKIDIQVTDIRYQDGSSAMECYRKDTGQAVFLRRGMYTFSLAATDGQRKNNEKKISILVDER